MKNTNIKTTHNNNNTKTNEKATKKIKNWAEYNKSLVKRGNLSIFISDSLIKNGCITTPKKTNEPGRPQKYSNELIEFMLTIRELFHLPLRQTAGFVSFLFSSMGIISGIPDYTTISKRMPNVKIRYYGKAHRNNNEGIVMLIDSSGFKVFGEGEWKVRKHGTNKRRTWRETHIAINHETRDIVGFINTSAHVHDNTQLLPLLQQVTKNNYRIQTVIGDGAYETKDNYNLVKQFNASMIAPPRKSATYHYDLKDGRLVDVLGWEERNNVIRSVMCMGLDNWKDKVGYHRRSLVENAFYRWKTIFGANLKSRKEETQYTEQCLRAKIINRFNEIGLPKYDVVS